MDCDYLNTFGLAFNFIGTLLIIFYIRKDPKEWVKGEEKQKPGEKWHALIIKHSCWLYFGVALIAIGFLLGLIGSLLKCE